MFYSYNMFVNYKIVTVNIVNCDQDILVETKHFSKNSDAAKKNPAIQFNY